MSTNTKLLLAEALDALRGAMREEVQTDQLQLRIAESSKRRGELPHLRRQYGHVYRLYVKGLRMINHCRFCTSDAGMAAFCEEQLTKGIEACERVRDKETSILLPSALVAGAMLPQATMTFVGDNGARAEVQQIAAAAPTSGGDFDIIVAKDGYRKDGPPLLSVDGSSTPLKGGAPIRHDFRLDDGEYQLAVINHDGYSIAAPAIEAVLQCEAPTGGALVYRKRIPPQCAWCRFVGVVGASTVKLMVASDAWLRKSHITVEFVRLTPVTHEEPPTEAVSATNDALPPTEDAAGDAWLNALPSLTAVGPMTALGEQPPQTFAQPQHSHPATQRAVFDILPLDATHDQRLARLESITQSWHARGPLGYNAHCFYADEAPYTEIISTILRMSEPTPLDQE